MVTKTFFEDYAAALISYSAEKIATFYQAPMTVYSDQGLIQVTKLSEVEAFWKEGVKQYKEQGIEKAIPDILTEEQLSNSLFVCKVLWKSYNAAGNAAGEETNFYILSKNANDLKICGLIIMTK